MSPALIRCEETFPHRAKESRLTSHCRKERTQVALLPGDMELFENKTISEQMLHGLSLHELRLLRNEV